MYIQLLLDPDFAQALILGAKKSHIEVDTVRISRLIMLTYIHAGRPLAILQAQLARELRKGTHTYKTAHARTAHAHGVR